MSILRGSSRTVARFDEICHWVVLSNVATQRGGARRGGLQNVELGVGTACIYIL